MPKQKYTLIEIIRYNFDKSMAAGPIALIGWLALITLLVIIASSLFMAIFGIAPEGSDQLGIIEGMWSSLMRTMDAGAVGADLGWAFRIVSLIVTIVGIFVFSALIGILGSGLDAKLEELRKGKSRIIEKDHTIILNWSSAIFDIINELVIANESRKNPAIIILADKDKVEMEDEIKAKITSFGNTQIICRTGDPSDLYDLEIANPQASRSIIILSPDADYPDSQVIKSTLALIHHPNRRAAPYQIAAEIREKANVEIAKAVGGQEVQIILADDFLSRIIVQSCRQTGLSGVYTELLDFDGCEIYTIEQPEMIGKDFAQIVKSYQKSTPIGICDKNGNIKLNPENHIFAQGEKLVIIAEDDASIIATNPNAPDASNFVVAKHTEPKPEKTLIIGWNHRGAVIAQELSRFVAKGSRLVIAADCDQLRGDVNFATNENLVVEFKLTDTSNRFELDALDVASFDHVLVLGYSDDLTPQAADTKTLITLLHIRKIAEAADKHISVVSEMIDVKNRELAEITRADDFVVSNKIISLMLAQASENPNMEAIFGDLLDEEGSELYMKPIFDYINLGQNIDFNSITYAALARGEIAIGYKNSAGIKINPDKAQIIDFATNDKIIVLAQG
jgi:ion channel POLLUX/CASTOR